MQRTTPRRAAMPSAACAVLTALTILLGCAPEASAEGLESTGTTGVFVSLATAEEEDPSGQGEVRQDPSGEKPAATQGQGPAESLPETGDETGPAAIALSATALACLAAALLALRARRKRRERFCEQSRLFAAFAAVLLVTSCADPLSASGLSHPETPAPQGGTESLRTAAEGDAPPLAAAVLQDPWGWHDCLFLPSGTASVLESVSLFAMPTRNPPDGFDPQFEWTILDPSTGETTVFATGRTTTVPWEALGKTLFVQVSDRSGAVKSPYRVDFAERVGPPVLKGSVSISGDAEVGGTLRASVSLDVPCDDALRYEWYVGESEGARSKLVAEGPDASSLLVDEGMRGLHVTCVVLPDEQSLWTGEIQADAGQVPKEKTPGHARIDGECTLGNTLEASVEDCPLDPASLKPTWYLGSVPSALDEKVHEGWSLALEDASWEGRYLSCVVEVSSVRYEGSLRASSDSPVVFKAPGTPAVDRLTLSADAKLSIVVACDVEDPMAATETVRIEILRPEGEWETVRELVPDDGFARCEIPIPEIAEWGSASVRATAVNSGGTAESDVRRVTAQFSVTVPLRIEGRVNGTGDASFEPQTIENTGSLNVAISGIATSLADDALGRSLWTCRSGSEILFSGDFGSAQSCDGSQVIAPGGSCELLWSMTGFEGGETSLGAQPSLYGTIGYTFRLPSTS